MVSVFFCGNDLSDSSPRLSNNPRVYFDLDQAGRLCQIPSSDTRQHHSQFLNRYSRFYVWRQDQFRKLRDRYRKQVLGHHRNEWGPFLTDERGDFAHAWEVVAAVVRQFDREVRADGSEFVLLILPCSTQICTDYFQDVIAASGIPPERFDPDLPEDRLGDFCRQEGIRCVSLIGPFREAAPSSSTKVPQEWLFNAGRGHFNEAGNAWPPQLFRFSRASKRRRYRSLSGDTGGRSTMTAILGISAFYHDSAAALVVDGESSPPPRRNDSRAGSTIIAFPSTPSTYCLRRRASRPSDFDYVGFYDKPLSKFERLLETYLALRRPATARSARRCRCG